MKIKNSILALLTVSAVFLSGCSINLSGADLIHPPKTTGNEAEIQKLIEEDAESDYTLKYPKTGDYRSAIITEDLNYDESPEAVAFYNTVDGENSFTHMLVMNNQDGAWQVSFDYTTEYSDIDCVQFTDYDSDGVKEILVGFVTYSANVNELAVFDYNPETATGHLVESGKQYTSFSTGDYDGDNASEIMLLTLSTAETKALATLIDYEENSLYPLTSCNLNPSVTKFENVQSALISEDTTAVIVDGFLSDSYNTQVIAYDTSKLILKNISTDIENSRLIKSMDFDGDGLLEIPTLYSSAVDKATDVSTASPMVLWNGFDKDKFSLSPEIHCVVNFDYGYSFELPSEVINSAMAVVSQDSKTVNIYKMKSKGSKLALSFRVVEKNDDHKAAKYSTLTSNSKYDYTYMLTDEKFISDEVVNKNFTLFNESV